MHWIESNDRNCLPVGQGPATEIANELDKVQGITTKTWSTCGLDEYLVTLGPGAHVTIDS